MLRKLCRIGTPIVLAVAVVAVAINADAQSPQLNTSAGLTLTGSPLALRGYDPVSYFAGTEPMLGSAEHQVSFGGATYRFATAESLGRFERDPARYVPAYGGFCAYGVSVGKKFDGDPLVWRVVDSRLYLNLNRAIQDTWLDDVPGNVVEADRQWVKIRDRAPADL